MQRALIAIVICVTCLAATPPAMAARRFQMVLVNSDDPAFSDLGWLDYNQAQPPPPRRSVFFIPPSALSHPESAPGAGDQGWVEKYEDATDAELPARDAIVRDAVTALLEQMERDWSRIDAVVIDEPYLAAAMGALFNPCADDVLFRRVQMMQRVLINAAAVVRGLEHAEKTRFWVNFSGPEIDWMNSGICHPVRFNDWYMDVVSIDIYGQDFAQIQPLYNDLFADRPTAYQQLALIPGTYSASTTGFAASEVADRLQGFFNYANTMNLSCSLLIGRVGVTQSADGCPIWVVAGFWGGSAIMSGDDRAPIFVHPHSEPIKDRWEEEFDEPRVHALLGRVEVFHIPQGVISGWVVNRTAPDELPQVDVWLDGQIYLGGTLPSQQRADVETGTGVSLAGYTFTIPSQYRYLPGCHEYVAYAVHPANTVHPVLGNTIYCL
jgi:hypothetical protein